MKILTQLYCTIVQHSACVLLRSVDEDDLLILCSNCFFFSPSNCGHPVLEKMNEQSLLMKTCFTQSPMGIFSGVVPCKQTQLWPFRQILHRCWTQGVFRLCQKPTVNRCSERAAEGTTAANIMWRAPQRCKPLNVLLYIFLWIFIVIIILITTKIQP